MKSVCCNLCGRDDWVLRFAATTKDPDQPEINAYRCTSSGYGTHPQIVECRHCGYIYANPRWVDDDLLEAYSAVEDHRYEVERSGRVRTFIKHLESVEKWTGPGNNRELLDVGAYTGVFVEVANARDWQATGVEPSRWATQVARQRGLSVIEGTLDSNELRDRRFDVVTLWDVIEHVDDPSAELEKAYHLLKPGGMIAVHTMDIESLAAKIMGKRWPWLMDMHIHYFGRRTLRKFLEKSGFELLWIGAQGRYLSLGYLATRVSGLSRQLGRLLEGAIDMMGLNSVMIPVNFGDLMTAYARRPESDAAANPAEVS